MPRVKDIPFSNIPRQSALFLDYLSLSPAALRFYQQAPKLESLKNWSSEPLADLQCPRSEIASILRLQNKSYGCDPAVLRGIDELEKPHSVAILTGQQVGLFGGPLYTIYKAVTAIRITKELRRHGIPAAAVFWMEGDDHDLAEVTRCTAYHPQTGIQSTDFRSILFRDASMPPCPVGSIRFSEGIRDAVRHYADPIAGSKWIPEVRSLLESTYKPGATFTEAFAQFLLRIFHGTGLIFYDPQGTEAKRLISKVFQRALCEADAIHDALRERNRELETAGFHAQVNLPDNSTVLFLFVQGERRALEKRNSGFGIRNSDRVFSLEEMLALAEQTPERLSPNVLLRPLIQDHLFPTIAYVGGSSELAYFAQIEVLYRHFGRPMPVLWPRNSFTLIEPETASVMERLGIDLRDCFAGKQFLTEKVMRNSGFPDALAAIDQLQERLNLELTEIEPEVRAVEAPLVRALETAKRKILHNTQSLRSKIIRLEGAQNSSTMNAINLFLDRCLPNQNLQERELGILPFLAAHGPSLLDAICAAAEIGNFAHRLVWLEPEK